MNHCPTCNAQVRAGARFCGSCGTTIPKGHAVSSVNDTFIGPKGSHSVPSGYGSPILGVAWPGGHQDEYPLTKRTIRLGRQSDNEIVLNFPTISGHHLQLDVSTSGTQVTDLGSLNGVLVNGRKIPPNTPHLIEPGDILRVGDAQGNSLSLTLKPASGMAVHTRRLGMQELGQKSLLVMGRDASSDIHLDHPSVSWRHAELRRQNGNFVIRDLGSANGIFVDGRRIAGEVMLGAGAVIQIGPFKLAVDGQIESLTTTFSQGYTLDAIGLELNVGTKDKPKLILNNISLSVQPREFIALVGGSGAGKSTLMRAMNGFFPATAGQMLIDGQDLYAKLDAYRSLMAYVPQDDIIHKELPVDRALWYAAKLRLPDASEGEIQERIKDVLAMVDMTRHAEKAVHVLSGGQRKRVSIAVELLGDPELLYLDEPTTGLDPGLEKKMMYDLNRIADGGKTVLLVTHATDNIDQCHHVTFLVQGRLAFYGPPDEAKRFFNVQDFADIYLKLEREIDPSTGVQDILQPDYQPSRVRSEPGKGMLEGLLWSQHYHSSPIYQKYVVNRQRQGARPSGQQKKNSDQARRRTGSILRQTWLLARRNFDLIRQDKRTLFILLIMMPLLAILFVLISGSEDLTGKQLTAQQIDDAAPINLEVEGIKIEQVYEEKRKAEEVDQLSQVQEEEALKEKQEEIKLTQVIDQELKYSLVGADEEEELNDEQLKERLNDDSLELKDGASEGYLPAQLAVQLLAIFGLALTQAGTFGAAYEIVKERPIFKRERAVNLRVAAYVFSKIFVLAAFAVVQVLSTLVIFGLKVDLGVAPVFEWIPHGSIELFITLYLAMLASIMFGLFISAIVPSRDTILYIILVQLFIQLVLSGTLFPIEENYVSKSVIAYWTMDGLATTVDVLELNQDSRICSVIEVPNQEGEEEKDFYCEEGALDEDQLSLYYERSEEHLLQVWGILFAQAVFWGGLTIVVQMRSK